MAGLLRSTDNSRRAVAGSPPTATPTSRCLLGRGVWGVADQVLISATNFVTMVLLARGLGPTDFGVFVLVYMVMQFANSLQSGLILQPHNVLGDAQHGLEYARYTAACALCQLAMIALGSLLVLIAAGLAVAGSWPISGLLFAMAPTLAAWQAQEFLRRVLYTEMRTAAAFGNDLLSYGGQMTAIAALWWQDLLTAPVGMWAIGASSAVAASFGLWQLRRSLFARPDMRVIAENWRFGKWLGAAEIGYWLSSQIYMYLTGIMLGPAAAGVMKAGYVIFGPLRIIGFFLRSVLPTWFARVLATDGKIGMHAQLRLVYAVSLPVLGSYCLLAAIFAEPILRLVYGNRYAGQSRVVVLYAVFAFVAFLASVVSAALRAQQRSRRIFATQMTAFLTLPAGWLLIQLFGIEGAVGGMILTSLVVNITNWRAYRRDLQTAGRQPMPASPATELAAGTGSTVSPAVHWTPTSAEKVSSPASEPTGVPVGQE